MYHSIYGTDFTFPDLGINETVKLSALEGIKWQQFGLASRTEDITYDWQDVQYLKYLHSYLRDPQNGDKPIHGDTRHTLTHVYRLADASADFDWLAADTDNTRALGIVRDGDTTGHVVRLRVIRGKVTAYYSVDTGMIYSNPPLRESIIVTARDIKA